MNTKTRKKVARENHRHLLGAALLLITSLAITSCGDQGQKGDEPDEPGAVAQVGSFGGVTWTVSDQSLKVESTTPTPALVFGGSTASWLDAPLSVEEELMVFAIDARGGINVVPCIDDADCVPQPPCPDKICPPVGLEELSEQGAEQWGSWQIQNGVGEFTCGEGGVYCLVASSTSEGQVLAAGEQASFQEAVGLFSVRSVLRLDPANVPCLDDADCVPPPPCGPDDICPPELRARVAEAMGW